MNRGSSLNAFSRSIALRSLSPNIPSSASVFATAALVPPAVGLVGCVLLAVLLPVTSVLVGAGVVLIGALAYGVRLLR